MPKSRRLTNPSQGNALVEESSIDGNERLFERFPSLRDLGLTVYTPEGLDLFLRLPQPRFGGKTATDLIKNGQIDVVVGALAEDHEGFGP